MMQMMKSETRSYASELRDRQAAETRTRIVRALCELLVDERPSSVSIPAVARRAGVSVRGVYHHFPTKDDLFDAIEPYVRNEVRGSDRTDEDALLETDDVVALMRQEIPALARNAALFTALTRAGIDDDDRSRDRRRARLAILSGALARQIPELDHDECARLAALLAGIGNWASVQRMEQAGLAVDEIAELLAWAAQLILDAAASNGRLGFHTIPKAREEGK